MCRIVFVYCREKYLLELLGILSLRYGNPSVYLPIVVHVYTQSSVKFLRVVCNNAYWICVTHPGLWVFLHIKLPISSGHLMAGLEACHMPLLHDVHLHATVISAHFNCLMLIAKLHFSPLLWDDDWSSSCSIVSVFTLFQYRILVQTNSYHVVRCV